MNNYDPKHVYQSVHFVVGTKTVIKNSSGEILVLKRSDKLNALSKWSLPGGAIEKNESPEHSAIREINEEVGVVMGELKLLDVNFHQRKDKPALIIIGYTTQFPEIEEVRLNWEHTEYKFLAKKEALKLNLTQDGRYFIEKS